MSSIIKASEFNPFTCYGSKSIEVFADDTKCVLNFQWKSITSMYAPVINGNWYRHVFFCAVEPEMTKAQAHAAISKAASEYGKSKIKNLIAAKAHGWVDTQRACPEQRELLPAVA